MGEAKQVQSRERVTDYGTYTTVVIPVHNKWELTEACLRSLAETLAGKRCEIIVIDNASSDATKEACPALGQALFGDFFRYHRAERNLNFGPASNLGANMARGDFLLFLNNDTLAVPGYEDWYDKLLQDFSTYPNLAATSPVLLYPPKGPLGATVQHLGVFVTPSFKFGHLYEGIPADSALVKKRRFFQIITGACAAIPRKLFLEHNGFNEGYKNGFEDVDLCARLWNAGYRMTVNPEARLYHLTSQTPGRHTHERENSNLLTRTTRSLVAPDWHFHLKNDGYELRWTPWLTLAPHMPIPASNRLAPLLRGADAKALLDVLRLHPLWYEGYMALAARLKEQGDPQGHYSVLQSLVHLRPLPEVLLPLREAALAMRDAPAVQFAMNNIVLFCRTPQSYIQHSRPLYDIFEALGLQHLQAEFAEYCAAFDAFREQRLLPFFRELHALTRDYLPSPLTDWAYTLWRELRDLPERECWRQSPLPADPSIAFSVLMPVYNPKREHIKEAVESLLAQEWPYWELCIVDDCSTDATVAPLLRELAARDPRIKVCFRETNGGIAAATNSALGMAACEYLALMDQDDVLTPDAFSIMARTIREHPRGMLFYSDEDKLLEDGTLYYPYFKNGHWDKDLLLGQNMVNHLGVYRADHLRSIGGFREGFDGAQDYDMLLRYTQDMDAEQCVHVPKVLYHWRSHEQSTASSIEAKSYTLDSAVRALAAHCERNNIAAVPEIVPQTAFTRLRYRLPDEPPLVSLIVDAGTEYAKAKDYAQSLLFCTDYPRKEVVLMHAEPDEPETTRHMRVWGESRLDIRFVPYAAGRPFGQKQRLGVEAAQGSILGFLAPEITPLSENWIEELISRLLQPGVGVIGGRLIGEDGKLWHQGYIVDKDGQLVDIFRGSPAKSSEYFAWELLARTVSAVDPRCMFTHASLFKQEWQGAAPGAGAGIDYSLRLAQKGLRTVTSPFAVFRYSLSDANKPAYLAPAWENGPFVADEYLHDQWKGKLKPLHPNLGTGHGSWSLCWEDEPDSHAENSAKGRHTPSLLVIAYDLSATGAPRSLLRLLRQLKNRYAMRVLALLDGPLLREFAALCPVVVARNTPGQHMFGPRPSLGEVERALERILQSMPVPDCIVGNTAVSALAYPVLKSLGRPIITRVVELDGALRRFVQPQHILSMIKHSSHFVAVSDPVRAMLLHRGVAEEKISVIQGGIEPGDTVLDQARRDALLRDLGLPRNMPILWSCGTFGTIKGGDLFFETCQLLRETGKLAFRALWAGTPDGSLADWERRRNWNLGQQFFTLLGHVEKPYLLMQPGDIYLLTSREDSFPLGPLEAAERGLPIIGFADSGGMEAVIKRGAGLLVPKGDVRVMAKLTGRLLDSPESRLSIGQNARRIVKENYTLDVLSEKYIRIFEHYAGAPSVRGG